MKTTSDQEAAAVGRKPVRAFFRVLLGFFLLYAGISHLSFSRIEFEAQVPNWVPMNKDLVVILSGIMEILLGASLALLAKHRITMGWIAALFFILVFPGNIAQYVNKINAFGLDTDNARFMRLFFQPVLVIWALWSTGAWAAWKNKRDLKQG